MSASPSAVTRRLAAIVIADVVGYTRLMERDDTTTFARLGAIRSEVVDPAIVAHDGRIVQTAGDGWLAEFPSALAALRASIQIQRAMGKRNAALGADERIDHRIGVNLGDIIVRGSEIAGDGVNVASRLESLAEPGAICVSSAVREQVHGQLDATLVDIGEQRVKNIARPIRVYRVGIAGGDDIRPPAAPRLRRRPVIRIVAAAAALVVIGLAGWTLTSVLRTPAPARFAPYSVAAVPFATSSNDPASVELANRLTRDLATALTTAFNRRGYIASFEGASRPVDARAAGRSLNAGNVVAGDVSRSDGNVAVSVRVVDTETGALAWSETTRFETADVAADHAIIVKRIAWHLRGAISNAEQQRAMLRRSSRQPIDLVLRGRAAFAHSTSTVDGIREAYKLYDEALRVDPNFVFAMTARADAMHWELYENPSADRDRLIRELDTLTRRAVAVGDDNALAWGVRAETLPWLGRLDEAFAANERIRALDPYDLAYLGGLNWLALVSGRPQDSLDAAQRMVRIDPSGGADQAMMFCRANLLLGRYGDAVPACERATTFLDASWRNYLALAAAYAQNGDLDKAAKTRIELLKRQPGYTITKDKATPFSDSPEYLRLLELHFYPGLRKAGLPE